MEHRYLIGSRNLSIEDEYSDYDYAVLVDNGGTFREIQNEYVSEKEHCYHYDKEYINKVARFEIDSTDDFQFIYNAENFRTGMISDNPFNYKEKWVENLKNINFYDRTLYSPHAKTFTKRFYHIVYNLECLKQNTLYPTMERVKAFHDKRVHNQDYLDVIEEINCL